MNDVENYLSVSNVRFIRIHQSYLVNFDYIKGMNFTTVTMPEGTVLQISEDKRKKVRSQFCIMAGMEMLGNECRLLNILMVLFSIQVVNTYLAAFHNYKKADSIVGWIAWSAYVRPFRFGPVEKLKKNGLLYGIIIISIVGGHFYDGKTERTNPDGNSGYRFYDSTGSSSETD